MKQALQNFGRFLAIVLVCGATHVAAAEIRLRSECRPQGAVILLGEVAEIFAADDKEAATLAAVELVPAPAPGNKSFLRVREIQDQLEMRGLNMAQHRLSGASQVSVVGVDTATPKKKPAVTLNVNSKQSTRLVHDAIVKYLTDKAPSEPWDVDLQLDDEQSKIVAAAGNNLDVIGTGTPKPGKHSFDIAADSPNGTVHFTVEAQIDLPPAVVVATRMLAKGAPIRPGDIRLERNKTASAGDGFQTLEEVYGLEATRSIAEGQVLDSQSVRQQLLVHKGDVVTVYSRRPGIQVRVTARSRDDGALGEVVNIESLTDRSTYLARVKNTSECEVLAVPVTATEPVAPVVTPKPVRPTGLTKM